MSSKPVASSSGSKVLKSSRQLDPERKELASDLENTVRAMMDAMEQLIESGADDRTEALAYTSCLLPKDREKFLAEFGFPKEDGKEIVHTENASGDDAFVEYLKKHKFLEEKKPPLPEESEEE